MSKHLEFMKLIVTKPVYVLKKDMVASKGGKKMSALSEVSDSYISDITDEKVYVNGVEHRIKRLFIQSSDSGLYAGVGWVLNTEMNFCMVCSVAFGMFTYQHHCKACGNIVCDNCSLNRAQIAELEGVGPKRVCLQCYWGQEIVTAFSHKPPPNQPKPALVAPPPVVKPEPVVVVPEPPPEDPEVVMRKQQQAQFQKEALERIGRNGSLAKHIQPKPASIAVPPPVVEEQKAGRQSLSRSLSRTPGLTRENSITRDSSMSEKDYSISAGGTGLATNVSPMRAGAAGATVRPSVTGAASSTSDKSNNNGNNSSSVAVGGKTGKLSSYGEMTTQSPIPGFVLKTKRNDQTKIFVNVCSHANVPYKAENPSSGEGAYDMEKQLYMVVGPPLEYTNEKDNSYCVIYDTVVHPDEVLVCSIDPTGVARSRLCTQALELIAIHFRENLDPSYKILKVSSNYKGGNESGGKVKTQPIVIPHKNAFHALTQMTTNPADLESSSSNGTGEGRSSLVRSNSITPANSGKSSGKSPLPRVQEEDEPSVRGSVSHVSARDHRASSAAVMESINRSSMYANSTDSVTANMESTLKVIVKSISSAAKMTNNNFSAVLDDLKTSQYAFKDMLITPEPGFVVSAQKANRGQQVFINVCHHPLVAMLTVKAALDKGRTVVFDEYPCDAPIPYIIGAIDNEYVCTDASLMVTSSAVGSKCIVIDLIIPSSIMLVIIQDESGDLRDRMAVEMLENAAKLNILFDGNYTLPLVAGGRLSASKIITPVINQTEDEKKLYVMSFVGKFFKQGHGVKSWKERLVHIIDSKLKYFDLHSTYKGDFNIDDCSMSYVPNAECQAPMDAYPFKISNFVTGGEYMYCYVNTQSLRELFSIVIVAKIRQLSITKDLMTIPDLTTGWLKKQGHMVKNWKRRFFVLSYGVLKYYEKNGQEGRGSGENELGSVGLKGATVKVVVNSDASKSGTLKDCRMSVESSNGKDLLIEAESVAEKNAWFDALKKHIIYANQYC